MKIQNLLMVGLMFAGLTAHATLFQQSWNTGFANGGVIPDGNVTGWSDTRTVSGIFDPSPDIDHTSEIVDVNVTLTLSGGYNGDIYGYLVHSSGFAVLLNRIGKTGTDAFGNSGAGMSITLDDQAATDVHNAAFGVLSGSYMPDGRNVNPATVTDLSTRQNGGNPLAAFNGLDANGSWTLFLADMSGGDISTVTGWGLDISVVPEPITMGLGIFACAFGTVQFARWRKQRSRA